MTKPTVAYHARRLGIEAEDRFARRYDWKAVQEAHDSGLTMGRVRGAIWFLQGELAFGGEAWRHRGSTDCDAA